MRKKKKWNVVLSERDRIVLRDLFYSKGLDLDLLMENHFKDLHKSTVIKRLLRLVDGGLIEKRAIPLQNKCQYVYVITSFGLTAIDHLFTGKMIRKELKGSNLEHDLMVAKIYFKICAARNLNDSKFENEIQSIDFGVFDGEIEVFRRLNTDIFFALNINDRIYKVAIEYERSHKNSNRWSEYLLNYHLEENVDVVLYICENENIKGSLINIEMEYCKKYSNKIFFCTLSSFFSNLDFSIFENTNGKFFKLNFHN